MSDNSKTTSSGYLGIVISAVLIILGFMTYSSTLESRIMGALLCFVLLVLLGLFSLVGLIPIGGQVIFWFVGRDWIYNNVMALSGLPMTWVTEMIFILNFIISCIVGIIVGIIGILFLLQIALD